MTQTTAPPPEQAIGGPPNLVPLVRPVVLPPALGLGRMWTAGLDRNGAPTEEPFEYVIVSVTEGGHWWRSDDGQDYGDRTCRGCGRCTGWFAEYGSRCPRPATAQSIATALLASVPRPAPVAPRALYAGVSA